MDQAGYQVARRVRGPRLAASPREEARARSDICPFVTEKYLDYLDAMAALDIDVAGEYL
jgi:hypothetical protein